MAYVRLQDLIPMLFDLPLTSRAQKEKPALLVVLFMLLVSPQLAACSEVKPAYTAQDSGKRGLGIYGWLDNNKVVFYNEQRAQAKPGDGPEGPPIVDAGNFVWDTAIGTLKKDPRFEGAANICMQENAVTFLRKSPTEEKKWLVVTSIEGQETVAPLINAQWFNRFSCRYYLQKPEWVIPNHTTLPLMDGQGFLDWAPSEGPSSERNQPLSFHLRNASEGISLPIRTREVWHNLVRYAPFKNAYLLYPVVYIDPETGREDPIGPWPKGKPVTVWWLTPDGKVTTEAIPYMSFMRGGSRGLYPTREGIFNYSHKTDSLGQPGDAGGYLAKNGRVMKLITGMLDHVSISPDGCKIAFVHDPYDTTYGKDRLNRITVKIINLCQEDRHAR